MLNPEKCTVQNPGGSPEHEGGGGFPPQHHSVVWCYTFISALGLMPQWARVDIFHQSPLMFHSPCPTVLIPTTEWLLEKGGLVMTKDKHLKNAIKCFDSGKYLQAEAS